MKTIHIDASNSYDVHIGHGVLSDIAGYAAEYCHGGKIAIVSDSTVYPLWGEVLSNCLRDFAISSFVFPAGEGSKSQATLFDLLQFLAEREFTRSDLLIALGGGVTGDITGFAASIYLRGIAYIQIPTTLLAMVDSSVGGKTAIDLPAGKNLVGSFYQPKLVLCDLNTLQTLDKTVYHDGCAEVIKYGVLFDNALFEHLAEHGDCFDKSYVIPRCIELKQQVVAADEFDRGQRQLLNLGHTVGHGIEKLSHYTISHGRAVAAGMAIIAKAAWKKGLCDKTVYDRLCHVLQTFALPITTDFSAAELYECCLSDKKRSGDRVNLILPTDIGCCNISPTATDTLQSFIEAGL